MGERAEMKRALREEGRESSSMQEKDEKMQRNRHIDARQGRGNGADANGQTARD